MLKHFFTSERWVRNRLLIRLGLTYILTFVVVCVSSLMGKKLFPVSLDTARAVLSTVMGVSGSILGFLVIYLTLALDSIRRYFGRHSISVFKRDPIIWVLCVFFSYVIVVSLLAFCVVDQPSVWLSFLYNLSCISFVLGIVLIVPIGIIILNRSDTAIRIKYLLDSIEVTDFRPRPQNDVFFGTSYWMLTEDSGNTVDRFTAILLHNIGEGNNNIVASMFRTFYSRIAFIVDQHQEQGNIEEVVLRFYDILLMAFDEVKVSGNEAIIKLIFSGLNSGSFLAASNKMGPLVIVHIFKSARTMIQYLIEHENEQLAYEGLWWYYHMARSQVQHHFPPEADTEKFAAIRSALVYDYDDLVDRTFNCSNKYITENAVRMQGLLLDMVIRDAGGLPVDRASLAKMMSYHTGNHILKWASREKETQLGFLTLYLHGIGMLTALKENTSLSLVVVMDYCRIANFLIENGYYITYDLKDAGALGELILTNAREIKEVVSMMTHVLSLNKKAWLQLTARKSSAANKSQAEKWDEDLQVLEGDVSRWLKLYYDQGIENPELERLIQVFQVPKG